MQCLISILDCSLSKSEAKTEWSNFSFVKLCYIKRLHETETANGVSEMQFNSLKAGGAYVTAKVCSHHILITVIMRYRLGKSVHVLVELVFTTCELGVF